MPGINQIIAVTSERKQYDNIAIRIINAEIIFFLIPE